MTTASKYGATTEIGDAIGDVLAQRGLDVDVTPPQEVTAIEDYDAVVIGSAVYLGKWMKPARQLVERAGSGLVARPVWLFSSGPVGDPLKPVHDAVDVDSVIEVTTAREHRLFAGKVERAQLSFGDRAVVSALHVQEGEFRDWDEIRSWAAGIADALLDG